MTQPQGPTGHLPPYGPPNPYAYPPRPTNSMAVVALILALVVPPVGLVLGIIARRQIRDTGEDGDSLALAGIVVGACLTALYLLMITFILVIFAIAADSAVQIHQNLPTLSPTPSPG
jgi:hypothetical protein